MKMLNFRSIGVAVIALALLAPPAPLFAQQAPAASPPSATAPTPSATAPSQPTAAPAAVPAISAAPAASTAEPAATQALPEAGHAPGSVVPGLSELSPWTMFLNADIIVQIVMVGLAVSSVITWTIFIAKKVELGRARFRLRRSLKKIAEARSLAEAQMALGDKHSVLSMLLAAALREAKLSAGLSSDDGIKERAASSFSEYVRAEARHMRRGMGFLATIGATAPFIGLFGTVWGIMNSFIGISKSQTTNLAVVAPGIAEALLATAIGLVAAIPAVIIYNHFSREIKVYLELVARASGAAGRLLSRDLDRSHGSAHRARAAE
ncbi:outer membrane transport energization protein ExbB [Rhodopseudomonas thermotolerans]|uniref:Biopolymer transport protein ExbB n=2 Tax=Rhodopseudomonas TaxID=1073 RepID=A0A336JI32_9BRAD|nr:MULTISPECIES: tonB-system energizer ExbB [Rhodopseudomonas]RED42068.1 outer membrane transport energization protein ExbB [Rhodopseudomonas pentothenatexigens]REG07529.1 outer membrane transport energization protein ExbB [Rhodopseudomonas thermotolerans]SSW89428.1 outer membrane transport energization protein ExbB [Rhodopseudomonas pentothenatexigens]